MPVFFSLSTFKYYMYILKYLHEPFKRIFSVLFCAFFYSIFLYSTIPNSNLTFLFSQTHPFLQILNSVFFFLHYRQGAALFLSSTISFVKIWLEFLAYLSLYQSFILAFPFPNCTFFSRSS